MRRRLFRGVVSAMLAVVVGVSGSVLGPMQPAQAQTPPITVGVWISAIASVASFFGGDGGAKAAIEAAKREILAEIAASEKRILDHIDETAAGDVKTCIRDSSGYLNAFDSYASDPFELRQVAGEVTHCANLAGERLRTVQSLPVANYLTLALAEVNAIAMVFRTAGGLETQTQLQFLITDYQAAVQKLRPVCTRQTFWTLEPLPVREERVFECTAYNGDKARGTEVYVGGQRVGAPVDVAALENHAARNTSRPQAQAAIPVIRDALTKVQRNFVTTGVEFGQTVFHLDDGPLSWQPLGNPVNVPGETTTATAIASTRAPDNRRHVVAVVDGEVRHRIRNADGSFTPWGAAGSLGHAGTATAVTAASNLAGQVHVTAVINGQIYHRFGHAEGQWTPWALLGNPGTATALASTVDASGGLHLVAVLDGQTHHRIRNADGSWTPWGSIGHAGTATSVAAVFDPQGTVQVAAIVNGKFQHRARYPAGWWSSWATPGAHPGIATAVAGAVDPNGNVPFAVVVDGGVLSRTRLANGAWTNGWMSVGNAFGMEAISAS